VSTIEASPPATIPEQLPDPGAGRLGPTPWNHLRSWVGLPWARRLGWAAIRVPRIRWWEKKYTSATEDELRQASLLLRGRARNGESLDTILPEAFGLACVACWRAHKMRPFDVQIAAGVVLHKSGLAELATGEGKTLSAVLPSYLNALPGKGVHVTTVNDYLARRDAEFVTPIHKMLGLTVGAIQQGLGDQDRARMYKADITYGTASELGFDFLRDRLKLAGQRGSEAPFWAPWVGGSTQPLDPRVQRAEHNYALVDEADNIFIDEARTPLIIASPTRPATEAETLVFRWANKLAQELKPDEHFRFDLKKQKLELTDAGKQMLRWSNPPTGTTTSAIDKLEEALEQALHAHYRFRRDQQYMVDKGKIILIDEATGRQMPDRHWREGLHQAVEAKEGVQITKPTEHAAQITFQSYFRLYKKLAGMTGTAATSWWEIFRVYGLWVVRVPTNKPVIRQTWPDRVFPTEDAKFDAVVAEVQRLTAEGRAILIGTRSVEKSDKLSAKLTAAGVEHKVLNARHHAQEAVIVSEAGQGPRVTVATNMAGRGTDIKLSPEVRQAGGLHVLGTERHESRRIDRQLEGRAGRQGDPGSAQFFLSLEDELLEGLGVDLFESLKARGRRGGNVDWDRYLPLFVRAQSKVESRHYGSRVDLLNREKRRQEVLKDLAADPYVD
jgi:preprotein translocase subunit SecA